MKLRVFTLRVDPASGAFDDSELRAFCDAHAVLAVEQHMFDHDGERRWALLVSYRDAPAPGSGGRGRAARTDWRNELDPDDAAVFEAVRAWRNARAQREGRPAYVLLTNKQVADIARSRPGTLAELGEIKGIGDAKLRDYGEAILATLAVATSGGASAGHPQAGEESDPQRVAEVESAGETAR